MEFYDSNTGKLLFTAPVGRTMDEFLVESSAHGWPSFRDAEVGQQLRLQSEICVQYLLKFPSAVEGKLGVRPLSSRWRNSFCRWDASWAQSSG